MTVTIETAPSSPTRPPVRPNGWLVIGSIFTILVIIAGTWTAVGWLGYRTQTQTQVYQQSITELSVDLGTGDLTVVAGSDNTVSVTRRLHWSFRKPTFQEQWDGQRLTVTQSCGGFTFGPSCGVDYTLHVPAGTTVQAHTGTGDINLRDIHGSLRLDSGTGDVTVAGAAGDLWVQAGTGDLTATGVTSGHVDVSTGTGDIKLQLATSPQTVSAEAGTGDITITVPQGGIYHVTTDTGTGDTNVGVARNDAADRTITVHTGTGDIDISYA